MLGAEFEMKNDVDPREALVHLRHLELVVEVGNRALRALDDRDGAEITREVDEQALEELDLDVLPRSRGRFLQHLLTVFEAEERLGLLPGLRMAATITTSSSDAVRSMMSR